RRLDMGFFRPEAAGGHGNPALLHVPRQHGGGDLLPACLRVDAGTAFSPCPSQVTRTSARLPGKAIDGVRQEAQQGEPMLKVYHAQNTRSVRIVWLCEELGIPYELKTLKFAPEDLQSETYLAIHPLGKVPSIDDDGLILNESGAIAQYLLAKHGKGRLEPKPGTDEFGKYLHWFHFAEATFMGPLGNIAQHSYIRPEDQRIPQVAAEAAEGAKKILGILDRELADKDYICGTEFTAAD